MFRLGNILKLSLNLGHDEVRLGSPYNLRSDPQVIENLQNLPAFKNLLKDMSEKMSNLFSFNFAKIYSREFSLKYNREEIEALRSLAFHSRLSVCIF
jgi:hypothetical protein